MTLLSQWVEDTRAHLDGDRSEEANQLAAAYTAGDGTITLAHSLGNIAAGAILTIGTNTLRVVSANASAKTATVIAGYAGSTDAAAASGAMVRVNPRFTDHLIVRRIGDHLASLSSPKNGLFKVATLDLDYSEDVEGYEITGATGLQRILEVRREEPGVSLAWPRVQEWDLLRSAPTADFPSGVALRVRCAEPGYAVQVVYAGSFTPITDLAANVSTTGVTAEMEDIPPLGAAIRLMSGREVARNQTGSQGDTRRASEVPPGAVARSYGGLVGLWTSRVAEEAARLKAMYPTGR